MPRRPVNRTRRMHPALSSAFGSVLALCAMLCAGAARGADAPPARPGVFIRFKVTDPPGEKFRVSVWGWRHAGEPWNFPELSAQVAGGAWGEWVDLSAWPWHAKADRSGGVAEWPAVRLHAWHVGGGDAPARGCTFQVQLADKPDEAAVVHSFTEKSAASAVGFLVPTPLREHAKEFETGSQMTARHRAWADDATGGRPVALKQFQVLTALWGHYDPALARQDIQTLKALGFNVFNEGTGLGPPDLKAAGVRLYHTSWMYEADPRAATKLWTDFANARLATALKSEEGRWEFQDGTTHWVLADEVKALDLKGLDKAELNNAFRAYLREKGATDADFGKPLDQAEYPLDVMDQPTLPRDADLPARRLAYYAAKFGHAWSAKQLRHSSDLIRGSLPGAKTETLPADHGFFDAWGAPHVGMSHKMLDLFELGARQSVDQLSAEDWLGLNHMYGPAYTWSGAQSYAYFNAVMRSAMIGRPMMLRSLITPSDDKYLRLKAYSGLGQGAKSLYFWTYGPTYIGTENYWSDLRSMYDGIAKVTRAIEKSEDVLMETEPVRDPVAILYSVSHDFWNTDNPAAFVEKRLLWHALRHLGVQPDFLREEDVEAGRLKDGNYKALYVVDWCVSRRASAQIDEWTKAGGVTYLSAGAATRDEFFEPYVPPYAAGLWPDDAAAQLKAEKHRYNERTDLPTIKPMTSTTVGLGGVLSDLPVIGCRLNLRADTVNPRGAFHDDNRASFAVVPHGAGQVFGVGFCPMLAYGQMAGFKPTTLEEKWPPGPRGLIDLPLQAAKITRAAKPSEPVVEASLLTGPKGSVLVLANYTYQPIASLKVDLRLAQPVTRATSTEGKAVKLEKTPEGIRLELPLEWTDLVVLQP